MKVESNNNNPAYVPLLLLFFANLAFFFPYLLKTDAITIGAKNGDLLVRFMPVRQFAVTQLLQGHFPFWNPYNFSGHPFLADPETAMFYPFTYLFAILPPHLAFSWNYFLHFLLGGIGLFLYCRRLNFSYPASLVAAFIFEFSAPTLLQLYAGHLTPLSAMIWTPWLLWGLERYFSRPDWKNASGFGLLLVLQFLSGYALFTYFIGWLLLAYFTYRATGTPKWKKWFPRLLCVTMLALAVFLTQVTLTLELHKHTTREAASLEFSSSYSISKENIITLLVPKYYGENYQEEGTATTYFGKTLLWENTCYMGIISLTLLLIAINDWRNKATRFWLFAAFFTFIVALGTLTPLFKLLYEILPGFRLFRGYAKILVFTSLAVAILAGRGLDRLPGVKNWNRITCLFIPVLLIILLSQSPENLPFWKTELIKTYARWGKALNQDTINAHLDHLRTGLFYSILFSSAAIAIYWLRDRIDQKHYKTALCVLVFADFFIYAKPYFTPLDTRVFSISDELYQPILKEPVWTRVFHSQWLIANTMFPRGISSVGGHEPFVMKEYKSLANAFNSDAQNSYLMINPFKEAMDFLAAEYILTPLKLEAPFPITLAASGNISGQPHYLYRRKGRFSRYHIAHNVKPVPIGTSDPRSPEYLSFVTFMLKEYPKTVFVTPQTYSMLFLEKPSETSGVKENVTVISEKINRITLKLQLENDGVLTVSENYFPGWRASVDGHETEVFPANLFMKAIRVPAGNHHVEWYFVPTHLALYGTISTLSLLALTIMAMSRKPG